MKVELLTRIKDAEDAAGKRVAEAEAEGRKIVEEARRQAEVLLNEGKARADSEYQHTLAQARGAADEQTKKALASGKRQATNLEKRFEEGLDGAVERTVKLLEERL